MADGLIQFKHGTYAEYDASTKDENTLYFITDKGIFYKGTTAFAVAYTSAGSSSTTTGSGATTKITVTLKDPLNNTILFEVPSYDAYNVHRLGTASDVARAHTRLSDAINGTDNAATGGKAATPLAVKNALTEAKEYADSILGANDAMVFKGTLGTGGTVTALPTTGYSAGWTYKVITAGTYAGRPCEVGDLIIAVKDYNATSHSNDDWTVAQTNIDGAVTAAAALTADQLVVGNGSKNVKPLAAGTNGKILKMVSGKPSWADENTGTDTKYTFASGEQGSFTVTPSGGSAQIVSTLKTNPLAVNKGGTGRATLPSNAILMGNGTNAITTSVIYENTAFSATASRIASMELIYNTFKWKPIA